MTAIRESFIIHVTEAAKASGRMRVQALSAGVGSSGYYSPEVVERAARDGLIKAGTHMHLDHESESDRRDRPERSVRTIASVFTTAATYDAVSQALVGEIQILAPFRPLLAELGPWIGLSINGSATDVTYGEVGGRTVPIVEGLAAIDSVDWVTRAGRGGKVLQLLESGGSSTIRPVREQEPNLFGRDEPHPRHTRSPWGRPIKEDEELTPWGRPIREVNEREAYEVAAREGRANLFGRDEPRRTRSPWGAN